MLALNSVGASQLLLGTDEPFIGADTSHVQRLPISANDKAAILGGNAARLFQL
jgi:aminocarboxymuconate-semialdehyde decarboxylase